jgi:O-antigen ligase
VDRAGVLLLGGAVAWTLVTASDQADARPWPVVALLLGAAGLAAGARHLAGPEPSLVPGAVAVAVAGSMVLGFPAILRGGGAPTGYANSNATLAVLGAVAAAAAAGATRPSWARRVWAVLAVLLVVGVAATGSTAAALALGVAAALVLGSVLVEQLTLAVLGGAIAVSLTLGITVATAAGAELLGLHERAGLRTDLWAVALDEVKEAPLRGTGPGAYAHHLPAGTDADLRWAHHGYLQQAAEQGLLGLAWLLALVGWAYLRLWVGRERARARALAGAAAVTVVALHATVDHVLHDAVVPLTLAVLVGWATADRPAAGTPGSPPLRR